MAWWSIRRTSKEIFRNTANWKRARPMANPASRNSKTRRRHGASVAEVAACRRHAKSVSPFLPTRVTHLRLKIYPDGGVARLRVHGEVAPGLDGDRRAGGEIDLAAVEHGGWVIDSSDMFFGSRNNLILAGPLDGHARWLGNAPAPRARPRLVRRAAGRGGHNPPRRSRYVLLQGKFPGELLSRSLQRAARHHRFKRSRCASLAGNPREDKTESRLPARLRKGNSGRRRIDARPLSYLSRWRRRPAEAFREPGAKAGATMTLEEFNALPPAKAEAVLLDCCGCARWAAAMSAQRPFAD